MPPVGGVRHALGVVSVDGVEDHASGADIVRVPRRTSGTPRVRAGVASEVDADEEVGEEREGVYAALAREEEVERWTWENAGKWRVFLKAK